MAKHWETAAKARTDFCDLIEGLDPSQLDQQTWCDGWNPKLVLAHLIGFVDVGLGKFFLNVAKHKFDFDSASDTLARRIEADHSVEELVAILREKSGKPSPMPSFPEGLTVTDVAVHTQDVRRGLSLSGRGELDPLVLAASWDFLTEDKKAQKIFEIPKLDGLMLEASDTGFQSGSGEAVTGSAEDIVLALMGRPTLDGLVGDGVAELSQRLAK